jgi:hypothetical protein
MGLGIFLHTSKGVLANQNTIEEMQFDHPEFCLAVRIEEAQIPHDNPTFPYRTFTSPGMPPKHFAILLVPRFCNPWRLSPMENWKEIMGNRIIDWFLPIRKSPCATHNNPDTYYPLGVQFEMLYVRALAPKTLSLHDSTITAPVAAHLAPEASTQEAQPAVEV